MKIILTLNFAEENTGNNKENSTTTTNTTAKQEKTDNNIDNESFRGIDATFDNWHVNPSDGAVTNNNRDAKDFFSSPDFKYRQSSSNQEEALFEPSSSPDYD